MTNLALKSDGHTPQAQIIQTDANSLMAVISRAASDPATDVNKLERLLAMYERIKGQDSKAAYTEALAAMQPKLPIIAERGGIKDRGGNIQSTYALWEDINEAIKPVLAEFGFALSFRTGQENSQIVITGILSHREGHSEETTMFLPIDTSGSKNAVQAVGSSTSYGKRYTAQALLNLTSRGEDDDGKKGGQSGVIGESQIEAIRDMLERSGGDVEKFCNYFKIGSISELKAKDFERAVVAINLRDKKAGAK